MEQEFNYTLPKIIESNNLISSINLIYNETIIRAAPRIEKTVDTTNSIVVNKTETVYDFFMLDIYKFEEERIKLAPYDHNYINAIITSKLGIKAALKDAFILKICENKISVLGGIFMYYDMKKELKPKPNPQQLRLFRMIEGE